MKTSSPDPGTGRPTTPDAVRPAVFDRPLDAGADRIGWGDPATVRRLDAAIHRGRAQGRAEGFATGWAQGRRAAAEQEQAERAARAEQDAARHRAEAARIAAVVDQLGAAARQLDHATAPAWAELADVITDGALTLARAALGRELSTLADPVVDAVRTALHTLADPADVVLRLNPADHATLEQLATQSVTRPGLRLVADPEVEPGEVLALTPVQRLRLSLPAAVAAAEEVLRS